MVSSTHEPGSPDLRSGQDSDSSIDTLLASALQRNMSFTEDRKRQHTPSTANRPRQLRKGMDMEFDADQKENNDPVAPSTKKVTPSRLACIKQLEQEMTCSVCLDICVRPCTTPCGHDFCRKCLKQALRHQRRCPKCRASISLSAPICINTVLWNTIKLLFPKHAASAPDSPADAILTPASTNRAAVMANAVADLPMRRGLARVPFIPPRISRPPELSQPAASQRAPPSWLEGATRDSDPPASARRHRLASSSQQQTLSQAVDRWNGPAAGPGANAANGTGVFAQQPASPVGVPAHANTRRGRWAGRGGSNHLQRAHSAHGLRGPMPSMLDNLQRRLDDLPIPDILHRSNSSQSQESAAGLEASPSLRVRPFPNPPQARQPQPPAPASFSGAHATQLAQAPQQPIWPRGAAWQPPRRARPTWNAHAEPPAVRQGVLASEDWLLDLPDTPEAPRASAAAQRQAVADVLFEAAAGESAVGETEIVLEDPSWLDDAAAYDAAVAELDEDGISALDILSDGDTSPVNAMRSQARLNLSSLEHLLLSDSEEEDAEGRGGDNSSAAGIPSASDRQSTEAQGSAAQSNSMTNMLDSAGEDTYAAASLTATAVNTSQPASQITSEGAQSADQAGPESPPEMALGHDGRPRVVMSDVTSRFPTEQQLPQQLPEEGADKAKDSSFQVQRRGRQPRVCRSLLPTDTDTAADAAAATNSNSQGAPTSAGAIDAPILRPVLRSSARSQAMQSTSQAPETSSADSQSQTTRCTRRQARLNKQSSQSSTQHGPPLSRADLSSDDDFVVLSRSQRSNRSAAAAAASQAPPLHSGLAELHVSNQPASNVPQAGVSQQAAGVRKNRPRLQLNRNASKKSAEGLANGSEAAAGPTANMSNVS